MNAVQAPAVFLIAGPTASGKSALALALALALPPAMPHHDDILIATFAVVAFSVVGQGLTMKPMLRALGLRG